MDQHNTQLYQDQRKNNLPLVALVCIAKNEDKYIQEWIDYHLKLGFDHIYVYQNNWKCKVEHPCLTKINFDSTNGDRQTQAYNTFIRDYHERYDYAAFFDVDEFLVLKKHNNVKEFITYCSDAPAIGINWAMFGDNGLKEVVDNNYSLIERFTKRAKFWAQIKSIVKMGPRVLMAAHQSITTHWVNPDNPTIQGDGADNPNGTYDTAQINHYWCKTWPEWKNIKQAKGRVCDNPLWDHMFQQHNKNEIEDFCALNFFKK